MSVYYTLVCWNKSNGIRVYCVFRKISIAINLHPKRKEASIVYFRTYIIIFIISRFFLYHSRQGFYCHEKSIPIRMPFPVVHQLSMPYNTPCNNDSALPTVTCLAAASSFHQLPRPLLKFCPHTSNLQYKTDGIYKTAAP